MEYSEFKELEKMIETENFITKFTPELRKFADKHNMYLQGDKNEFYCSYDKFMTINFNDEDIWESFKKIILKDYNKVN